MTASSAPTRFGALFAKNGGNLSENTRLFDRLEEPEATTNGRTITAEPQPTGHGAGQPQDTARASRRRYTRDDKLRILRLADECKERGQLGALLRREGIYHSTLRDFENQRAQGRLEPRSTAARNQANAAATADKRRIAQLEALTRQLEHKLQQAHLVIEIQKKVSQLMGIVLPEPPEQNNAGPSS
jgi:transposase-like protein